MLRGEPAPRPKFTTLGEALEAAALTQLGLTFVDAEEQDTFLGWSELHARAGRVAGALKRRGVRPGDRVALVLPTGPGFMGGFFGAVRAGAVPVPLYPPVRLGRLEEYHASTARMLAASQSCIVLTDRRVRKLLGQAVERARPELGCACVEDLLEAGEEALDVRGTPESLALLQFSSGSTVDPKPVALSHGNLMAQCASLSRLLPIVEGLPQRGVSWLPLYHDMGLIGCLLEAVYYPGSLSLIPPELFLVKPALWLRTLGRHRGTVTAGPNFAYALCLKRVKDEDLEGVDLSTWKLALNGAEAVSPRVMNDFAARFEPFGFDRLAIRPVYGLAEATLAVSFTAPRVRLRTASVDALVLAVERRVTPGDREIASVGTPVPGVDLQVRDELDGELPDGCVGRLFVRGPSVMTGYFQQADATAEALDDGWLDTGDLGFLQDGELFVTGRAKDLVIIRGANHAPQEFEECVSPLPGVRTGCVMALPFHPTAEEEALLILAERTSDAAPGLPELIRAEVVRATGIRPHTVELLAPGTLPRTSSGKLRRAEALKRYLTGALTPPTKVNALRLATEVVKSAVAFVRAEHLGER